MTSPVAVVFQTHRFEACLEARYLALKAACPDGFRPFLLAEIGTPVPGEYRAETHYFDYTFLSTGLRTLANAIVPGSGYLVMLDFWRTHPGFASYWFIEYDVVFNGDWEIFLETFRDNPADLLACHIRRARDEPDWCWWSYQEMPGRNLPAGEMLRAFIPICRCSHRGLAELDRRVKGGWSGHAEALVPSVMQDAGFTLEDIGGAGPFTPPLRRNLFYTSFSCSRGQLTAVGTMRYVPSHPPVFAKRGFLYHPVKPGAHILRRWPASFMCVLDLLSRHPRRFLGHCLNSLRLSLKTQMSRS
jgi:hypothetical protein